MDKDSSGHLLGIVIINFRTPDMTINCIASLLPELQSLDCKVVVVDNNSADDSCLLIAQWLEENDKAGIVQLVESEFNGGFSYGNNLGIKAVKARNYLLLNSDTLVQGQAIDILLDTAEQYPDSGLISPRMEWESGEPQESCFRFNNPLSEFSKAAQTGFIDRYLRRFLVSLDPGDEIVSPPWTSFACVLIKSKVLNDVGLLDEGYFMYYEDTEFCHRARRAGWQITHNPSARVVHLIGGSSKLGESMQKKKRLPRYYYESRTRYFYQAYGRPGLTLANICWMAGRLISKLRQLAGRKDKAALENQWRDIWSHFGSPLGSYTHPQQIG
jgi:N-acetylglucosaminyl-diphospho-decaprenol L-rhamnosyltransferase